MPRTPAIPVIDLFAGPGGLGEGFASLGRPEGRPRFDIRLSIEKEPVAHQTLELRAFFRQFPHGEAPEHYYTHLRGQLSREELDLAHPREAQAGQHEAWLTELGQSDPELIRSRIGGALAGADQWVLIGGPPCQAYSIVGRSRNKGIEGYTLEGDPKARLYREYLRLIADFWPAAFVMENVRGLLSSKFDGESVFARICEDLQDPAAAVPDRLPRKKHSYTLHALARDSLFPSGEPSEFVIHSERYGIPQARHRVIVVGLRDDIRSERLGRLQEKPPRTVADAIGTLPRLRSGLSKEPDSVEDWCGAVAELSRPSGLKIVKDIKVREKLASLKGELTTMIGLTRGQAFQKAKVGVDFERDWFLDPRLNGICNHSTRSHIRSDLHRYLFAAAWAEVHGRSPHLDDFPPALLPAHENAMMLGAPFTDRFRVQTARRPSTTVTSHISKDGHYYIHYDPTQCRSLTVREAARLQTFPDNYFFTGPRTQQYVQVGNAVPPLLAKQIASIVFDAFR